ncbi:MAG: AmmeMemoRadiSam system protein A [Gammaproteobacteria bacterium]
MAPSSCIEFAREEQTQLLGIARSSIAHGLEHQQPGEPNPDAIDGTLAQPFGNFVTLMLNEVLRGCVGSIEPTHPLANGVAIAAFNAAFRDRRFEPLTHGEFGDVRIEISVLTAPEPIDASDNRALLAALRPGEDGLLLEDVGYRSTFLPKVWENIPEPAEFVRQLKLKAGLPANYWSGSLRMSRYRTVSFAESCSTPTAVD